MQRRGFAVRSKSDLVALEKRGKVGILHLNDPKRLNPMTADMGRALQGNGWEADKTRSLVWTD